MWEQTDRGTGGVPSSSLTSTRNEFGKQGGSQPAALGVPSTPAEG